MNLKVITWNLLADDYIRPERYKGVPEAALDPARRRALMCEQIVSMNADVYLLQEVEQGAFDAIRHALPAAYVGELSIKSGRIEGSAILVRTPRVRLAQTKTVVFETQGRNFGTLALLAELQIDDDRLGVASTHLEWSAPRTPPEEHVGLGQMSELLDGCAELLPEGTPWIVGGDMNAISQSPPIEEAERRGLSLACRAQRPWDTTNINRRRRKLDYLLCTADALRPTPGQLPQLTTDEPMPSLTRASDHLPVEVVFERTQKRTSVRLADRQPLIRHNSDVFDGPV